MTSISIFPVEVLDCITSIICTGDQIRLWQGGDRILNIKLKNGGLTKTSLQWASIGWMPWPRLFFSIFRRLRDVEWSLVTRSSLCPTLDLNLLPPTLQRLQLNCRDSFLVLANQNVKLNELLPALQVLKLNGRHLSEIVLKNLPEHLIELSVTSVASELSSAVLFRDLPTTIEDLHFHFHLIDLGESENDLPSSLKSLFIHSLETSFDWFAKLPRSLNKLVVEISTGFAPIWTSLPPLLEVLDFAFDECASPNIFPLLPIHLKSLQLVMYDDLTDADIPLIPKNLTRFNCYSESITPLGLRQLPASLTDNEFRVKMDHPEALSFFHPETRTMHLDLVAYPNFPFKLIPFPIKLTSLQLNIITDAICELLPPQLTYLKAEEGIMTAKGASQLPRSLKTLDIPLYVFDANETLSHLTKIRSISLASHIPSNLDENWMSFLRPSSTHKNLESGQKIHETDQADKRYALSITISKSVVPIGEASIQSLQLFNHLSVLNIYYEHIPVHYLRFVPKNLKSLHFGLLKDFPTPADLSTLPNRLQFLELAFTTDNYSDWKDEDLAALPRSLQTLVLKCPPESLPNLTHNIGTYLPPYLMLMKVNYRNYHLFETPITRLYGKQ